MPRRMSFALTIPQFLDGSKTVTRRMGWTGLKVGDELIAVEKCMGLRKGERQVVLGRFVVTGCRREALDEMDQDEVDKEGFPDMCRSEFFDMFCRANKCNQWDIVTRIEFQKMCWEPLR